MNTELPTPVRILLMGSSEITFSDLGVSPSLTQLLTPALTALAPDVRWEITPHIVYQRTNMPGRCLTLAEREEPDLIVLWMGGNNFSEETVSFAVYHRSRRLYPYFDRLVNLGRGPAAGDIEGAGIVRSALFRSARAVGRMAIGRRSWIDPDEASAATVQTLELLLHRWPLLCRLPFPDACRQTDQREASRERVERYNAVVREACARLSVPCITPSDEIEASGIVYRMGPDQLHADLPSRRRNAEVAARHIVETIRQAT